MNEPFDTSSLNENNPLPETAGSIMPRRDFIRRVAAASGVSGAAITAAGIVSAQQTAPAKPQASTTARPQRFVGIQMGPHTMLDEGIERCLDLIQETAAVNCIMVYSHAYGGDLRKPLSALATDHGFAPRDGRSRNLGQVWVKTHDEYYKDTVLRHQKADPAFEYADRDLFAELVEPCRKRGIKLYARILEGGGRSIANFSQSVTQDIHGRPTGTACWNNPNCKNFWIATAEDLFRSYDLDGFQWGAERFGSLMNVILPWNDNPPTCFCEHCRARAREKGIDAERARKGYEDLYEYVRALSTNQPKPVDGVFTGFLRILLRNPEILSWEYQYRLSREEVMQGMHAKIKSIKPAASVGWHIDHQPSSWDLVARAELSYEDMAPYSDFVKFIAYHNVLGPRIRDWYLARFKRTILSELTLEQSLDLYYAFFGYDKNVEPTVSELARSGFSPDYVYRETKRSVASANGKTKIYTGIGFDVPGSPRDEPEKVQAATTKAFEAGANGIVISREYEEMKVPNLKAVGRAVRA